MARKGATLSTNVKKRGQEKESKKVGGRRNQSPSEDKKSEHVQQNQRQREPMAPLADRLDVESLKALRRFRKTLEK